MCDFNIDISNTDVALMQRRSRSASPFACTNDGSAQGRRATSQGGQP
jgi:hypothetical protein